VGARFEGFRAERFSRVYLTPGADILPRLAQFPERFRPYQDSWPHPCSSRMLLQRLATLHTMAVWGFVVVSLGVA
jgi:hypothetical protein